MPLSLPNVNPNNNIQRQFQLVEMTHNNVSSHVPSSSSSPNLNSQQHQKQQVRSNSQGDLRKQSFENNMREQHVSPTRISSSNNNNNKPLQDTPPSAKRVSG
jgi:hypothetical protein